MKKYFLKIFVKFLKKYFLCKSYWVIYGTGSRLRPHNRVLSVATVLDKKWSKTKINTLSIRMALCCKNVRAATSSVQKALLRDFLQNILKISKKCFLGTALQVLPFKYCPSSTALQVLLFKYCPSSTALQVLRT